MLFGPDLKEIAAWFGIPENIRDLSDDALLDFIDKWEQIDVKILTCLCAEVLRRAREKGI